MAFGETIRRLLNRSASEVKLDREVLLAKIRQASLFRDLPQENLEEMFENMETLPMKVGQTVIREGDEGDYYYLLCAGTAEVLRGGKGDAAPTLLATIEGPVGFGEDALISNAKRNATIRMKTRGIVMRLSKDGFNDFVKEPLVTWYSPVRAQKKVQEGARWIDVRPERDADKGHLPDAILIPFETVRERAESLEKSTLYICYCDNGRQSSTASFLLRQMGFNTAVMRGGLNSLRRAGLA